MRRKKIQFNRLLVHAILISGLVHLIYLAFTNTNSHTLLTQSGEYAIWTLILSLACTPLFILFGWQKPRRFRKILGIYSFLYLLLHMVLFIAKYNWQVILAATGIIREFNLMIGTVSLIIMLILFMTSNKAAIRRLRKKWKPLHRLVYPAAVLGCGHAFFINDQVNMHGLKYSIIVLALLIVRLQPVKSFFIERCKKRVPNKKTVTRIGGKQMRPQFLLLAIAILAALVFQAVPSQPATASEPYQYEKDGGFLTALFAPGELPIITHAPTLKTCSTDCHAAHLPGFLPERSWKKIVANLDDHFGETVNINPETRDAIEAYLSRYAADYTKSKLSIKMLDSIGSKTPSRITETHFFKRHHEDISQTVVQHESIRTLSNCQACHIGSGESGSYDDRDIQMPGD